MNSSVAKKLKKASRQLALTQKEETDEDFGLYRKVIYKKLKEDYTKGRIKFK